MLEGLGLKARLVEELRPNIKIEKNICQKWDLNPRPQ